MADISASLGFHIFVQNATCLFFCRNFHFLFFFFTFLFLFFFVAKIPRIVLVWFAVREIEEKCQRRWKFMLNSFVHNVYAPFQAFNFRIHLKFNLVFFPRISPSLLLRHSSKSKNTKMFHACFDSFRPPEKKRKKDGRENCMQKAYGSPSLIIFLNTEEVVREKKKDVECIW